MNFPALTNDTVYPEAPGTLKSIISSSLTDSYIATSSLNLFSSKETSKPYSVSVLIEGFKSGFGNTSGTPNVALDP